MTLAEARVRLRVSRTTLWKLTRDGELPVIEIGGRRMVDPADLTRYIDRNRRSRRRDAQEAG